MILLDAGHGGYVEGVTQTPDRGLYNGLSSFSEGAYNRMIVSMIAFNLSSKNVPFHVVTPENEDIPLGLRVMRVNAIAGKYRPHNCFLLSVHQNGYKKKSVSGFELFTSIGQTRSDDYAEHIASHFERRFPNRKKRWYQVIPGKRSKEANFAVLTKTSCPAVLTEWEFMTNPAGRKYLLSDKGISDQSGFLTCMCIDIQNQINKRKL